MHTLKTVNSVYNASMPSRFQLYKQKFKNNFIMLRDIKYKVFETNLKRLLKVSIGLTIICGLMLFVNLRKGDFQNAGDIDYIVYYFLMTIVSLFTVILSFCFLKIKKSANLYTIYLY